MNIVVVGGGSKVALHFTKLATAAAHTVHSLVRNDSHDDAIRSAGGSASSSLLPPRQPAAVS